MLIDSEETYYYGLYFPEDIEHLKSNYEKIEEKRAKLPWWKRIFG